MYCQLHVVSSHSARQKIQTLLQLTGGLSGKLIVALTLHKFSAFYGAPKLMIIFRHRTISQIVSVHCTFFIQFCLLLCVRPPKVLMQSGLSCSDFRAQFCLLNLYHLNLEKENLVFWLIHFFVMDTPLCF